MRVGRYIRMYMVLASCLLLFVLTGCDATIHEYPHIVDLTLRVKLSADMAEPEYYCDVICDTRTGTRTDFVTRSAVSRVLQPEDMYLRFTTELYRVVGDQAEFVERRVRHVEMDNPIPQAEEFFEIESYKYRVLVWADYVPKATGLSWYYSNEDLRAIVYNGQVSGDNNDKDAYTGTKDIDLSHLKYSEEDAIVTTLDIPLHRPLGRFKLISTDLAEFEEKGHDWRDVTTKVTYKQYVSAGYNVEEQRPNKFDPTRTITTSADLYEEEAGHLLLSYDYLFVNGGQSNLLADFYFYDAEGKEISHWYNITIPILRNRETLVRGDFLTSSYGTNGVGINDNFENEFVIPVNL